MIKNALQLIRNMGARYTIYRMRHELEKKTGVLKKKHPLNPPRKNFISLKDWRANAPAFLIPEREKLTIPKIEASILKEQANRILKGDVLFFSHEWKELGRNYDWITNPDSGYQYDINKHWSEISDLNPVSGDIKYVWEKSRFAYLLTIMRYDYHFRKDNSEFVFSEIESWIDANPINQGPNWLCSQETSLRIMNWCYALAFYKSSSALNEERWSKIQHVIYWSLHHVYHHIDFSRIAVRNNHAITETLMLTVSELLFPFIPETKVWAKHGRKWFEQEVAYQIYKDGTFLQFSMNYHRVVIQLLTLGIALTELHNKPFSKTVYDRAYKSLNFLYQNLQEENGYLPNYGANDGALFFPLSNMDYRDYRPQLNALHYLLTDKLLYEDDLLKENTLWMCENTSFSTSEDHKKILPLKKQYGAISFPIGGYYLLRETDSFTFIRCGKHNDRPGHADNLHLDIWVKGENILRDSGTYKYNTDKELLDFFAGTASHNTVVVNDQSQMLKGSRFIWYYWTQAKWAKWYEFEDAYVFSGKVSAFRFLNSKASHIRTVAKMKSSNNWDVEDVVKGLPHLEKKQIWHHDDSHIKLTAINFENNTLIKGQQCPSYNSVYYGNKQKGMATCFGFNSIIKTTIQLEKQTTR